MTIQEILDIPFEHEDFEDEITFRDFFIKLLIELFEQEEEFSGKRPFGNSGWKHDLTVPLIRWKVIEGGLDSDGYVEWCDDEAADKIFSELIQALKKNEN